MKDKDIYAHRAVASSMNYLELSSIIRQISAEKEELQKFLTAEELKKYNLLITIYSQELEYTLSLTPQNLSRLVH